MANEIPEFLSCDYFELSGLVPVNPEQVNQLSVHERVLKRMNDMAERLSLNRVKLQMPPRSMSTLGTRYTEIDFGRMLGAEISFDVRFANPSGRGKAVASMKSLNTK